MLYPCRLCIPDRAILTSISLGICKTNEIDGSICLPIFKEPFWDLMNWWDHIGSTERSVTKPELWLLIQWTQSPLLGRKLEDSEAFIDKKLHGYKALIIVYRRGLHLLHFDFLPMLLSFFEQSTEKVTGVLFLSQWPCGLGKKLMDVTAEEPPRKWHWNENKVFQEVEVRTLWLP